MCENVRMPPVDRHNPKRAASSESRFTLGEFMREYPTDETCLVSLWRERYSPDGEHAYCPAPTCKRERTFKSVSYAQILEMLQRHGSLEAAMERAQEYSEGARQAICNFPDSEFKRALLWAPEFVVAREK